MCQKQTHAPQQTASLFNQIVGAGVQRGWDIKTERLGGLEIDDQLEPGGLLHRKFGRLLPTRRFFIAPLGSKISKLCFFLSLIHISEPTRLGMISYAVFCL